jgi:hypothetical protein
MDRRSFFENWALIAGSQFSIPFHNSGSEENTLPKNDAASLEIVSSVDKLISPDELGAHLVLVEGYHQPDDGGGGFFVWHDASDEDPDEGLVFAPKDTESGRWHRIPKGPGYSVKWFGAHGTGTGNDAQPIQKAIDRAYEDAPFCPPVYLPSGSYPIASPLQTRERVHIQGVGKEQSKIVARTNLSQILSNGDATGVDHVTIEKIGLDGKNQTKVGLSWEDVHRWTLRDIRVRHCEVGIRLNKCYIGAGYNVHTTQNKTGIVMGSTNNSVSFYSCNFGFNDVCIHFPDGGGGKNCSFYNTLVEGNNDQIAISGSPLGVHFSDTYTEGMETPIVLDGAKRVRIDGTSFTEGRPVLEIQNSDTVTLNDVYEHDDFNPTRRNTHAIDAHHGNSNIQVNSIQSPYNTAFLSEETIRQHVVLESKPVHCFTNLQKTVWNQGVDTTPDGSGWSIPKTSSHRIVNGILGNALQIEVSTYDPVAYHLPDGPLPKGRYTLLGIYRFSDNSETSLEVKTFGPSDSTPLRESEGTPIRNSENTRVSLPDAVPKSWGVTAIPFSAEREDSVDAIGFWHREPDKMAHVVLDSFILVSGIRHIMDLLPYDVTD